jgi:DNA-binding response OmpR family regulator
MPADLKSSRFPDLREWALRMEQVLAKAKISPPTKAPAPERPPGPKRVLIIEDDKYLADFLEDCLRNGRYQLATAHDGRAGLSMIETFKPDLVVLDLLLPVVHGYDVLRILRRDPGAASVKVLVSTAKVFDADRQAAMRLGADAFLPKPYTVQEFLDWVARLIGQGG